MSKKKTKAPAEWVDGRIVMPSPPAEPLRGRGNQRFGYFDIEINIIPFLWFFDKLDVSHRDILSERYRLREYISPEAHNLLINFYGFFEQKYLEEKEALVKQKSEEKALLLKQKKDMALAGKESL